MVYTQAVEGHPLAISAATRAIERLDCARPPTRAGPAIEKMPSSESLSTTSLESSLFCSCSEALLSNSVRTDMAFSTSSSANASLKSNEVAGRMASSMDMNTHTFLGNEHRC